MNPTAVSRRSLLTAVSGAAALTLLAACGSDDASSSGSSGAATDAASAAGTADASVAVSGAPANLPAGWTWAEGTGIPSTTATQSLPVSVTDGTGTEVEVTDTSKIIVGGEDVADILAALGMADSIYAAPTNSVAQAALDAPEQYEYSQKTGAEGLLSLKGTLFIGNNVKRHGDVAAKFREAGVDAVVVDDQQSVADKIRAVAEYVGAADAGEELAGTVESQLEEATTAAGDGAVGLKVLAVTASGAGGANAVIGSGTAAADMLEAVGATSVGVEEGLTGYSVKYSDEGLLATEPDVILMGDGDLEEWGGLEGFLEAFPTLSQTPAGTDNAFVVMPSEQIKVSGVGVGAGAKALAQALTDLAK